MFAATAKKLYDYYKMHPGTQLNGHEIKLLAIGNVVAFVVAMIAIRTFINFLTKHGFKVFGYYRIFAGILIIILVIVGFGLNM